MDAPGEPDLNFREQMAVDNVAAYGWHCVMDDANQARPAFAYSVGFWETVHAPEFIVFGLRLDVMHHMLEEVFRQLKDGVKTYDLARWSGMLEGRDCISRRVHPSQIGPDNLLGAFWYRAYRTGAAAGLTARQLFWPGKLDGLYPWDEGCDPIVRDHQPLLYMPKAG